jgi:signal transduction histidine kinase
MDDGRTYAPRVDTPWVDEPQQNAPQPDASRGDAPRVDAMTETSAGSDELETIARPLLRAMEAATGLESTYLTAIDEERGIQRILFAHNAGSIRISEGLEVRWEDTLCRRALASGVHHTTDVPSLWPGSHSAEELGLRSYITAPIVLADGTAAGTLCGVSGEAVEVDEDAVALLRAFAVLIADHLARRLATREAEARLEAAERALEQRATFLATAQHQMKTPLSVIRGWAEMLSTASERLNPEQREQAYAAIRRASRDVTASVNDMLDETRAEILARDLTRQEVQIGPFLTTLVSDLARLSEDHEVVVGGDGVDRCVHADPRALRLVLEHLVENAVKYSPGGGKVEIVVDPDDAPAVTIAVVDEGVGIPEELDVFAPFVRGDTGTRGSGLGLHIVRTLIGSMDGEVRAERNPGGGSTFLVRLPARPLDPGDT